MPTWKRGETLQEQQARLSKTRRDKVLQASAEAIEEIDRLLNESCMEVITPTHPLKEHYHGEETDELAVQDRLKGHDDQRPPRPVHEGCLAVSAIDQSPAASPDAQDTFGRWGSS